MTLKSKKCYFIHIPKTAGNSVRKFLRDGDFLSNPGFLKKEREHHFGVKNAKRVVGSHLSFKSDSFPSYVDTDEYKEACFSFTVLRNPFDLLVSYYHHYIDNSLKKNWIDDGWANVNGYHNFKSFSQFIDGYCNMDPEEWHVPDLSKNLFGQIFTDNSKVAVDYAIFFENIYDGVVSIAKTANPNSKYSIPLSTGNISRRRDGKKFQDFYNENLKNLVSKKCEWELDTFYKDNKLIDSAMVNLYKIL